MNSKLIYLMLVCVSSLQISVLTWEWAAYIVYIDDIHCIARPTHTQCLQAKEARQGSVRHLLPARRVRGSGLRGWDAMDIAISPNNPVPMYQQIVDQVTALILSGELKPGDPLPSIRKLAADLLASVITTRRAYADLEAEGLIVTRPGLGTFVADLTPEDLERLKDRAVIGHLADAVRAGRNLGLRDKEIVKLLYDVLDRGIERG